jgi:hypothetical protein
MTAGRFHKDHDCWAKELLEGLRFVDPSKDWLTHMQQLMPIENPKGVAALAKQKFADSYREFDSDPTDPECPRRQRSTYLLPPHAPCSWQWAAGAPRIHQC